MLKLAHHLRLVLLLEKHIVAYVAIPAESAALSFASLQPCHLEITFMYNCNQTNTFCA